jgi:hypothetical protein
MKERIKKHKEYIIEYDDLPLIAFKSKEIKINWTNQSITNIKLPDNYDLKGKVVINKLEHNTNCHPRNKVEFKRKKSKDVIFNEVIPFQIKKVPVDMENISCIMKKSIDNVEINNNNENKTIDQQNEESITPSISHSFDNEIFDDISNYNINITIEQFEKIMLTFNIPSTCMLCKVSKNNDIFKLPDNIKQYETIIFPFISKNKYGIISYVNKIILSNKEKTECLVYIKHGKTECPSFMRKINKQLIDKLNLDYEPIINSIHVNEYIEDFKFNGYFMLYLLECFINKRNDDVSKQLKDFNEYITFENMIKSFKKYKEIILESNEI